MIVVSLTRLEYHGMIWCLYEHMMTGYLDIPPNHAPKPHKDTLIFQAKSKPDPKAPNSRATLRSPCLYGSLHVERCQKDMYLRKMAQDSYRLNTLYA